MNKKWKTLLIIFLSTVCLTGCSTDLKRKKSSDTNKLVEYNVYSDLSLILNQNNSLIISDKEISKQKLNEDEYNKKSAILMAQHLENIYKICNNRILQDFDKYPLS